MLKENCLHIGSIFKLHGYKGNIILYNENDYSFDFKKINHLFIDIDKILVPFFIERISVHKTKNFLIKLEGIDSEIKAKKILNHEIYFSNDFKPINFEKTKDEENIIGYEIKDNYLGKIGVIEKIDSQTSQKLIYVKGNKNDFCFPMNDHFIKSIDKIKKCLMVEIPKEIIDLN